MVKRVVTRRGMLSQIGKVPVSIYCQASQSADTRMSIDTISITLLLQFAARAPRSFEGSGPARSRKNTGQRLYAGVRQILRCWSRLTAETGLAR